MKLIQPNLRAHSSEHTSVWPLRWPGRGHWLGFLRRATLYALLWLIVVEGDLSSLWIGVPAVLVATTASTALRSPATMILHELFRFVPFFLIHSLMGGVDVAWRAVHPRMPIAPHLVEYPFQLPPGLPRVFMANTVSLLPGTLSADICAHFLKVHVLTDRRDTTSELRKLEQRVAALFGVVLPEGALE